jgi:hypothetical protein
MSRKTAPILLAASSLILAAFSGAPAPQPQADATLEVTITTSITSDGSGTLQEDVFISDSALDWFLSQNLPAFSEDDFCDLLITGNGNFGEWVQAERPGGNACLAAESFAGLTELESLTASNFPGAAFARLEILNGRLYYDLVLNMETGSEPDPGNPVRAEGSWIVKVPGPVVETNADKTDGRMLTWDMMEFTKASHLRAESKLGGGLGELPIALTAGAILLLCCCCVLVLSGGAAWFFLRRKNNPPPGREFPPAQGAGNE